MNKKENLHNYFMRGLTAFCVIAACVLFFFIVYRLPEIFASVIKALAVLRPVIYGLVIAFLINPLYNWFNGKFEPFFTKHIKKEGRGKSVAGVVSVVLSLVVFILIITALIALVIPQFVTSVTNVINIIPGKIDDLSDWTVNFLKSNKKLETVLLKVFAYEKKWLENDVADYVNRIAGSFASGVLNIFSFIKDFAVGLIFTLYLMLRKAKFACQSRKLLCAVFPKTAVHKILLGMSRSGRVFSGFINGKLLDSLIIGLLCFIGVTVLRIPYTMLIAVIVGVTNIIPVFGPYIGAIPCAALVLLTEPIKGLYFIIFIILLQALDGNFIGPKILGDRTGIDTFWVVFAIVVGGGLFGVLGMLIGVPTFAVLYYGVRVLVNYALRKKNMSTSSDDYTVDMIEKEQYELTEAKESEEKVNA